MRTQPDQMLVGREGELGVVRANIIPGRGTLVMGNPGIGRTALATTTARRAEASGVATLWVTATASLQTTPFGAFGWLLSDTNNTDADMTMVDDAIRVGRIVSALRDHGGRRATLVVIDDAHLLDERSIDAVVQALAARVASVIATAVTGRLPDSLRRLVEDGFLQRIELAPFDRNDTATLAAEELGAPLSDSTIELLWRWTAGSPSLLRGVMQHGKELGRFRLISRRWWWEGPEVIPNELSDRLNVMFDSLSASAIEVVDYLALCAPTELQFLERLTSSLGVLELESAGLVRARDDDGVTTIQFASDLVAGEWARRMPMLRRRHVAQRLLEESGQPLDAVELISVARWHLDAGPAAPLETLLRASSAVRLSDPTLSQQFADAAHRWHPSVATFVDLLDNHVEREDPAAARVVLEHAQSLVANDAERWRVEDAEISLCLFGDRDPSAARGVLARLRAANPGETRAAELSSLEGLVELLSARPSAAARSIGEVIARPTANSTVALRCGVTQVATLLLAGRTGEALSQGAALLEPAKAASVVMPTAFGMLRAELAFALLWRADLTVIPTAHPGNAHYPVPPLAAAPERGPFDWALMAGIVAHMRADHTQAVSKLHDAAVQQAKGKGIFQAEACAWLIVALCDAGRVQEASVQFGQFPDRHLAVLPGLRNWAAGVLLAAQGDDAGASRLLLAAAAEARNVGAYLIEARYLVEAAERCHDAAPIDRLDELATTIDAPLLQRLCRIAIAHMKSDVGSLLIEAEGLASDGLVQRAMGVAKAAGDIARRHGDNACRKRAVAFIRCLRQHHDHDERTKVSSPRSSLDLSRRESQVAELAAGGLTDREIAAQLVVSVRTIESHLASVYRKLGVTSRHEVGNALVQ